MTRARRPARRGILSRWTKRVIGLLVGAILAISFGVPYLIAWWRSLPLVQQGLIAVVSIAIVVLAFEQLVRRTLGVSPLRGILAFIRFLQIDERPQSGREVFETGFIDDVRAAIASRRDGDEQVAVEGVERRDQTGPPAPKLDPDVSQIVMGQSGKGKSTFVKSQVAAWDLDEHGVIAHGLSESQYQSNELETFFAEQRGQHVLRISSRGSDARWDPFMDYGESVREMQNIAEAMFEAQNPVETGWTPSAQTLLVAALIVTAAKHGDFAKLPDVLEQSPGSILAELKKVPGADIIESSLRETDPNDRQTAHSILVTTMVPLLESDLFDASLDRFSLREYYERPRGVVVLDNIKRDRYASGLWRLFLQSAIDFSFESSAQQYFVIDELDKLPKIPNVADLASAGRSASSLGIFALQDVHQLRESYGRETASSIYVNCPNRVCFNPGDKDGAEFALQSIGEYEVPASRVSHGRERGEHGIGNATTTHSRQEVLPILPSDLLQAETGQALVQSPHGWWFCQLEEPSNVT